MRSRYLLFAISALLLVAGAVSAQPYSADFGNETDPLDIIAVLGSFDDRIIGGGSSDGFIPVLGVVVMPDSGGGRIWIDDSGSDSPFMFAPGSWMQQSVFISRAALLRSAASVHLRDQDLWIRRIDIDR